MKFKISMNSEYVEIYKGQIWRKGQTEKSKKEIERVTKILVNAFGKQNHGGYVYEYPNMVGVVGVELF